MFYLKYSFPVDIFSKLIFVLVYLFCVFSFLFSCRPHPESIRVRGTLYPLAQRVAKNIFARLFLPNSFLTTKLREKAAMAYLSRPGYTRGLGYRGNSYQEQDPHPIKTYHIPEF